MCLSYWVITPHTEKTITHAMVLHDCYHAEPLRVLLLRVYLVVPQGGGVSKQLFGLVPSSVSHVQSVLLTRLSTSRVPCSFMWSLHVLAHVAFPQLLPTSSCCSKTLLASRVRLPHGWRHKVSGYACIIIISLTVQWTARCNCVIFLALQTPSPCRHRRRVSIHLLHKWVCVATGRKR